MDVLVLLAALPFFVVALVAVLEVVCIGLETWLAGACVTPRMFCCAIVVALVVKCVVVLSAALAEAEHVILLARCGWFFAARIRSNGCTCHPKASEDLAELQRKDR